MKRLIPVLLLVLVAGCGKDTDPYLREDPFTVREFRPYSGDRWIGNAICYGPHRDGQRPGSVDPSAAEIREDLALMLSQWNLLRIYGSTGFAETLLDVIRDDGLDMKVVLGVWIAPDAPEANRREVDAAIRLAAAFGDLVVAVSVGNETQIHWSAHRSPFDTLLVNVRRVRAGVTVPVTVADDFNYWNKPESRALAVEIDFITMHAHPMWNGLQLEASLPWLREQVAAVQVLHANRAVVLGETGWATSVHDQGEQAELIKGRPGETEQKIFYDAVRSWAEAKRLPVFFFEAFDENWKGGEHPAEVEKHWGLFRADRSAKAASVH
ncbi:MAG: glycosyl hydrolase family 17 protein [Candidatus Krumholzibacteriota bacterium]